MKIGDLLGDIEREFDELVETIKDQNITIDNQTGELDVANQTIDDLNDELEDLRARVAFYEKTFPGVEVAFDVSKRMEKSDD